MTGGAGECFGCGARCEPEVLASAGDAVLCGGCLARLLCRIDGRLARGANGGGGSIRVVEVHARARAAPAAVDAPCFVCGEPLDGEPAIELHGFAICAGCARGLFCDDQADDEPGRCDRRVIDTPGSGTEWCSRCGRAMPGPGSYRLVDGRPHCAACVACRLDVLGGDLCDACDRALAAGTAPGSHGFRLCAACRTSDPELALVLARARHRRQLARATRRILDGSDD